MMRTSRLTGLGACAERFLDDGLDRTCAPAAFDAATEAAIDLPGIARQFIRRMDGVTDIVVGDDVAGTDNHEDTKTLR